jgi:hypothetical protein
VGLEPPPRHAAQVRQTDKLGSPSSGDKHGSHTICCYRRTLSLAGAQHRYRRRQFRRCVGVIVALLLRPVQPPRRLTPPTGGNAGAHVLSDRPRVVVLAQLSMILALCLDFTVESALAPTYQSYPPIPQRKAALNRSCVGREFHPPVLPDNFILLGRRLPACR